MASVYHIVAIRVNETSWAHVCRLHFCYLGTGCDTIECTSMVTRIATNLGCLKMANLAYIEGDVPTLCLDHFVHTHILREEPDHSLSVLYGRKVI
jgi:hypothetical protein